MTVPLPEGVELYDNNDGTVVLKGAVTDNGDGTALVGP